MCCLVRVFVHLMGAMISGRKTIYSQHLCLQFEIVSVIGPFSTYKSSQYYEGTQINSLHVARKKETRNAYRISESVCLEDGDRNGNLMDAS